jgi:putative transport protein
MVGLLHAFFAAAPLAAIALALALGYLLGTLRIGTFALGPVAATLLVAIAFGQIGVKVSPEVKTLAFALFIVPVLGYTVPYTVANVLLTLAGPVIVLIV